ncbi:zinc finger BED domain-containing protein RICESLEEPER 2-like [Lotus japonicus]|uniref:zinc finger BED domain-containing protein RICESLEEPER 2-like n=1 Tax=Lotus japonicus TaxID=34305 RepID=UPI00258DAF85|nr:zinc finger BED domain-containing protein RICESLEEPER 2-like [Lotus japonicus]
MSTEQSFSSTIPLGDGQEGEEDSPYTMSGSDFGAVPETVLEEEVTIEVVGDKRKTRSEVWGHFEHKIIDGKQRAICVHCGKSLLGDPKQGTTHLRNHLNRCKEYQKKCGEQKHFKTEQKKSEDGSYVLNPEKARQALARMIVAHEYPLAVVDQSKPRFIHVRAPHSGRALGDVLIRCLKDWSLDGKLSTLTLDNCSANDKMIEYILDDISHSKLILGGRIFHMRCCAHILNLVVKDGLSVISGAIEKVRKSVNYWTLTPKREEKFEDACLQLNCPFKKPVVDCKTRWNSIFLMLRVAIEYKAVYERLSQREKEYEDSPSEDEWKMAEEICLKLELFYDVTNLFSGRSYPMHKP